jgi:hypothetical protein
MTTQRRPRSTIPDLQIPDLRSMVPDQLINDPDQLINDP